MNLKKLTLTLTLFVGAALQADTLKETTQGANTAPNVMNVDAAIMSTSGTALPGATIGAATRLGKEGSIYLGAEFGAFVRGATPSYAMFSLLGNAYYQFEIDSVVHPLIGVMAGPIFSTGTGASTQLEVLFRPGFNFQLGRSFTINVEPRLGVVGSSFVFVPQLGVVFAI